MLSISTPLRAGSIHSLFPNVKCTSSTHALFDGIFCRFPPYTALFFILTERDIKLTSPRSIQACLHLGIDPTELMYRSTQGLSMNIIVILLADMVIHLNSKFPKVIFFSRCETVKRRYYSSCHCMIQCTRNFVAEVYCINASKIRAKLVSENCCCR